MKSSSKSLIKKILFIVNLLCAVVLLFSYTLPYISPKVIPAFAILSLSVPFLIIVNSCFVLFWIVNLKLKFLLSAIVLVIGYFISTPFYKIYNKKTIIDSDIKVMSYNVRIFNHYKNIKDVDGDTDTDQKILNFIHEKDPDILTIQEFYSPFEKKLNYPFSYFEGKPKTGSFGLAIFSKYEIINKGSLNFKNSANNSIFIDVVKNNDTLRVYNVHLQSLKINPKKQNFGEKNSGVLVEHLENGFEKQATQTLKIINHQKAYKGNKIVCGDFNNTAYSWVYNQISKNKKDAFIVAGKGFGKSFDYFFPMRIDFILTDKSITINRFETFSEIFSDHYPIMARINLTE